MTFACTQWSSDVAHAEPILHGLTALSVTYTHYPTDIRHRLLESFIAYTHKSLDVSQSQAHYQSPVPIGYGIFESVRENFNRPMSGNISQDMCTSGKRRWPITVCISHDVRASFMALAHQQGDIGVVQ